MAAEAPALPVWADGVWGAVWEAGVWASEETPIPLTITTASLPVGYDGLAYSATIHATGGTLPYSFAVTAGALPDGLSLNAGTGAITGTPSVQDSFDFTITVTDDDSATDDQVYSVVITDVPSGQSPRQSRARYRFSDTNTTR